MTYVRKNHMSTKIILCFLFNYMNFAIFVYYAFFFFYNYYLHYVLKIRLRSLVDYSASHKIHLHSSTRAKGLMTFAIHLFSFFTLLFFLKM